MTTSTQYSPRSRQATLEDLENINQLFRKYPQELGYVRKVSLKKHIDSGELLLLEDSHTNELLGAVQYHLRRDGITTIYHIAVTHQRSGHGTQLIQQLPPPIQLKCTQDNPACLFYERLGFKRIAELPGNQRKLNLYKLEKFYQIG